MVLGPRAVVGSLKQEHIRVHYHNCSPCSYGARGEVAATILGVLGFMLY
jgi:hypothetical protein